MNESIRRIYELQVKLASESLASLKALQTHAAGAEGALTKLGGIAKSFGAGLLGGLSIGLVFSQLKDSIFGAIDAIDQLDKSATRLKMPVQEFAQLSYAAGQADTSIGELETGMKHLQKSFADFSDPAKDTTKILKALGVDPTGKSQTENLLALADGLNKVTDANMRTRVELALMGRDALSMSTFLQKGREEITRLTEESKKLNNVTSESLFLQGAYETELKKMQEAAKGLSLSLAEGVLPSLTALIKAFNESPRALELFRSIGEGIGWVLREVGIRAFNVANGIAFLGTAIVKVQETAWLLMQLRGGEAVDKAAEIGAAFQRSIADMEKFEKTVRGLTMPPPPRTPPSAEDEKKAAALKKQLELALMGNAAAEKHRKELERHAAHYDKRIAQIDELIIKLRGENDELTEHAKILREIERGELKLNARAGQTKERILARAAEADRLRAIEEATKGWVTAIDQVIAAQREAGEAGESFTQRMRRLTSGTISAEVRRLRLEIEELNKELLDTDDPDLLAGFTENIRKAQDRIKQLADAAKGEVQGLDRLMLEVADRADGYGKDLSGLFVDFATGAGDAETSFTDFAVSFLRQLAQMTLQTLIFEDVIKSVREQLRLWAAQRAATSTASSIGSAIEMGVASAKGNAFAGGNVLPFARGGVVTRPTLFAMAGGAGLMGEAGPEAVLPLHRGADGSLGVRGGSTVNVSVVNNASGARAKAEEETQPDGTVNVRIMIEDVVDKALTRGRFDNSMGQVYGSTRRGRM